MKMTFVVMSLGIGLPKQSTPKGVTTCHDEHEALLDRQRR